MELTNEQQTIWDKMTPEQRKEWEEELSKAPLKPEATEDPLGIVSKEELVAMTYEEKREKAKQILRDIKAGVSTLTPDNPEDKEKIESELNGRKVVIEDPSDEDVNKLLTGKEIEFLHLQRDYLNTYWMFCVKTAEMTELKKQYEQDEMLIQVQWQGMRCPRKILEANLMLMSNSIKNMVLDLNDMEKKLKSFGLTMDRIQGLVTGEGYVKEIPKL